MTVLTRSTRKLSKKTGKYKVYEYHEVKYVGPDGRRKTRSFKTKNAARAFASQAPIITHVNRSAEAGGAAGRAMALTVAGNLGTIPVTEETIEALQRSEVERLGTFDSWVKKFIDASREGRDGGDRVEDSTLRAYERYLGYAAEKVGTRHVSSLSREEIIALRDWLLKDRGMNPDGTKDEGSKIRPLSEGSVEGVLTAMRTMFKWMIDTGQMPGPNPARKITSGKKMKEAVPITKVTDAMIHTPEEVAQIKALLASRIDRPNRGRHAFGDVRNKAFIDMAFGTGMRNGELRALRWNDLDLEAGIVNVRFNADNETNKIDKVKTEQSNRTIALPPRVIKSLKALREFKNAFFPRPPQGDDHFVFGTFEGTAVIDYHASVKIWKRVQADAKVSRKKFHAMRHFYASYLFDKSYNAETVSVMLGHYSVEFTRKVYVHMINRQKRIAEDVKNIAEVFGDD